MAIKYHHGQFRSSIASLDLTSLIPLVGDARAALAEFLGLTQAMQNPNLLLAPLSQREAVLSSKIEGTQATLSEVYQYEAQDLFEEATPKQADIREIINYRIALMAASEDLEHISLSQRLIKKIHEILMRGVRGRHKDPGTYRRIQNWIGPEGCHENEARFIPAAVPHLQTAIQDWESFVHEDFSDPLIQLSIVHAEFEAIHPFLDGNGRVGRLLIPLFLKFKDLLEEPNFYLSAYLEANREEYYHRLSQISETLDWKPWCQFFLTAIIEQSRENQAKVRTILSMYDEGKQWVVPRTNSQMAIRALDTIFAKPVFKQSTFSTDAQIPDQTARRILREMVEGGLLKVVVPASGRRSAILSFQALIDVCSS